jgi:hypothetical protein
MTTTDPNADLIGLLVPIEGGHRGIVLGSAPWDPTYVEVDTPHGATVRVAAQVRREKGAR